MSIEQEPALERKIPEDVVDIVLKGLDYYTDKEGIEYLNGFALPPNNDEPWRSDMAERSLSNAFVRSANINAIVHRSGKPLFVHLCEVDLSGLKKPRNSIGEKVLTFLFGPRMGEE